MKKLRLLLFLYVLLALSGNLKAQVFGYPGATWTFHSPMMWGMCFDVYEKWEYVDDTVIAGIVAKDVKETIRVANLFPPDSYNTIYLHRYFKVSGDTVSILNAFDTTWHEAYNFSLVVGDTTLSPLNNVLNGWSLSCNDSIPYQCPAIVTDTGHTIIGGESLRFYTVKYRTGADSIYAYQTYYERIVCINYWFPEDSYWCGLVAECLNPFFVCYRDNDMLTDNSCADLSWFETLSIDDPFNSSQIQIYPNPANDVLFIKGLENEMIQYRIFSAEGKLVGNFSGNGSVSISQLPSGLYFITTENRTWFKKFIKD